MALLDSLIYGLTGNAKLANSMTDFATSSTTKSVATQLARYPSITGAQATDPSTHSPTGGLTVNPDGSVTDINGNTTYPVYNLPVNASPGAGSTMVDYQGNPFVVGSTNVIANDQIQYYDVTGVLRFVQKLPDPQGMGASAPPTVLDQAANITYNAVAPIVSTVSGGVNGLFSMLMGTDTVPPSIPAQGLNPANVPGFTSGGIVAVNSPTPSNVFVQTLSQLLSTGAFNKQASMIGQSVNAVAVNPLLNSSLPYIPAFSNVGAIPFKGISNPAPLAVIPPASSIPMPLILGLGALALIMLMPKGKAPSRRRSR